MSINNLLNPIVKKCEEDVNVIMGEFGAVRKIISRFDEVLLEKASKFSVDKLTHETKINYMTLEKFREYEKEFEQKEISLKNDINFLKHIVDTGHDELYERLCESLDHYASIIKKKIMDSLGGKPVDAEELKLHLACKADKNDTKYLIDFKADKVDLEESCK